jgi:hypothetical protein
LRNGGLQLMSAGANAASTDTENASDPPVRSTRIRPDGRYYFLDLPPGDYVLKGVDDRQRPVEARAVTIAPMGPGSAAAANFDFDLKMTTAKRVADPEARRRRGRRN